MLLGLVIILTAALKKQLDSLIRVVTNDFVERFQDFIYCLYPFKSIINTSQRHIYYTRFEQFLQLLIMVFILDKQIIKRIFSIVNLLKHNHNNSSSATIKTFCVSIALTKAFRIISLPKYWRFNKFIYFFRDLYDNAILTNDLVVSIILIAFTRIYTARVLLTWWWFTVILCDIQVRILMFKWDTTVDL